MWIKRLMCLLVPLAVAMDMGCVYIAGDAVALKMVPKQASTAPAGTQPANEPSIADMIRDGLGE